MTQSPKDNLPGVPEDEKHLISYQTNAVPWWIHVMWATFAVCSMIYLLVNALKDFIRWW